MSPGVHDRWAEFLKQRGFAIDVRLGAPRASAPQFDIGVDAVRCVDLNHFTALGLIGADARSFLQGYLTCDLDALADTQALVGAYCNIKGRVVADATVALIGGYPTLVLHESLREPVTTSLKKYLAFARSRFAAFDTAPVLLGMVNPPQHLALPTQPLAVAAFGSGVAIAVPGPVPRVLLALPHDEAAAFWLDNERRGQTGDAAAWDLLDVRAGFAHICAATSETFLPQMLDYDRHGAVSFTKGCYLGQEIVARTQHLGRPKRHLHHLTWSGATIPEVGAALSRADQSRAGVLVGVAKVDGESGEALAVLNDDVGGALHTPGITYNVS